MKAKATARGMSDAQRALAVQYEGMARAASRRLGKRLGYWIRHGIEWDDLDAAALLGLAQAAQAFDPEAGVIFWTFAHRRIAGAMMDHIRAATGEKRQGCKSKYGYREVGLEAALEVADPREGPEVVAERADLARAVRARLDRLPPRTARIIERHLGGAYMREIGADMGISASRVCQVAHEGRNTLRARCATLVE